MSTITVDKEKLGAVYQNVQAALMGLQLLLADLGCLHPNSINITTFVDQGRGVKRIKCPDCGETFEEELG